ncbi:MAG: hypothetical protein JW741_12030 [Sedimentisphaerales bacterium]|nr:hypothetical protein [Sedimentisphaerales bacterium]
MKKKAKPVATMDNLKTAVARNQEKAAAAERAKAAAIDAKWNLYARTLLGEPVTQSEQENLPDILDELGVNDRVASEDQAGISKLIKYQQIIAEQPVKTLAELRHERDVLEKKYLLARRAVGTASAYEGRRTELGMRIAAIRQGRPKLWKHLDALLPPPRPGVEPLPHHERFVNLRMPQTKPAATIDADEGEPERVVSQFETVQEPGEGDIPIERTVFDDDLVYKPAPPPTRGLPRDHKPKLA